MRDVRIVIVEDSPPDVILVQEALESQGIRYSLEHYANGEDAAEAFAIMIEAPELILLDLNVPRVSGIELLRNIRASPVLGQTPTAIITSSQCPGDRRQVEEIGADAYIVKPLGYKDFVKQVGTAIRGLLEKKAGGEHRSGASCCRSGARRRASVPAQFSAVRLVVLSALRTRRNR